MIAKLAGKTEDEVKALRKEYGITAAYKMVDTCAAEFEASTPYYYSVYGGENEADGKTDKKKVLILGSGPIPVSYTHLQFANRCILWFYHGCIYGIEKEKLDCSSFVSVHCCVFGGKNCGVFVKKL